MNELAISLAYKYVAVALMLAEANYCADHLRLPTKLPMQQGEIRQNYVGPPRLLHSLGSIDTDLYSFGFSESGRLRYITRLHPFGDQPLSQLQRRLAQVETTMTTNAARQLATNWLSAISVDVAALDAKYSSAVQQHFYFGSRASKVLLPIFDVAWGSADRPAVIVTVYAPKSELLQIRQNDESFSRRPPGLVRSAETLLAIPDTEFAKYSPSQRSNLVFQSSARNSVDRLMPEEGHNKGSSHHSTIETPMGGSESAGMR